MVFSIFTYGNKDFYLTEYEYVISVISIISANFVLLMYAPN